MKTAITYLGMSIVVLMVGCANSPTQRAQYDSLAKCLTEQNVKMYGTEWCPHCQNQKKDFSDSFQYVDYTDCDKDGAACRAAGVSGYPTWIIDGQSYAGEQRLDRLASLSGCNI